VRVIVHWNYLTQPKMSHSVASLASVVALLRPFFDEARVTQSMCIRLQKRFSWGTLVSFLI